MEPARLRQVGLGSLVQQPFQLRPLYFELIGQLQNFLVSNGKQLNVIHLLLETLLQAHNAALEAPPLLRVYLLSLP